MTHVDLDIAQCSNRMQFGAVQSAFQSMVHLFDTVLSKQEAYRVMSFYIDCIVAAPQAKQTIAYLLSLLMPWVKEHGATIADPLAPLCQGILLDIREYTTYDIEYVELLLSVSSRIAMHASSWGAAWEPLLDFFYSRAKQHLPLSPAMLVSLLQIVEKSCKETYGLEPSLEQLIGKSFVRLFAVRDVNVSEATIDALARLQHCTQDPLLVLLATKYNIYDMIFDIIVYANNSDENYIHSQCRSKSIRFLRISFSLFPSMQIYMLTGTLLLLQYHTILLADKHVLEDYFLLLSSIISQHFLDTNDIHKSISGSEICSIIDKVMVEQQSKEVYAAILSCVFELLKTRKPTDADFEALVNAANLCLDSFFCGPLHVSLGETVLSSYHALLSTLGMHGNQAFLPSLEQHLLACLFSVHSSSMGDEQTRNFVHVLVQCCCSILRWANEKQARSLLDKSMKSGALMQALCLWSKTPDGSPAHWAEFFALAYSNLAIFGEPAQTYDWDNTIHDATTFRSGMKGNLFHISALLRYERIVEHHVILRGIMSFLNKIKKQQVQDAESCLLLIWIYGTLQQKEVDFPGSTVTKMINHCVLTAISLEIGVIHQLLSNATVCSTTLANMSEKTTYKLCQVVLHNELEFDAQMRKRLATSVHFRNGIIHHGIAQHMQVAQRQFAFLDVFPLPLDEWVLQQLTLVITNRQFLQLDRCIPTLARALSHITTTTCTKTRQYCHDIIAQHTSLLDEDKVTDLNASLQLLLEALRISKGIGPTVFKAIARKTRDLVSQRAESIIVAALALHAETVQQKEDMVSLSLLSLGEGSEAKSASIQFIDRILAKGFDLGQTYPERNDKFLDFLSKALASALLEGADEAAQRILGAVATRVDSWWYNVVKTPWILFAYRAMIDYHHDVLSILSIAKHLLQKSTGWKMWYPHLHTDTARLIQRSTSNGHCICSLLPVKDMLLDILSQFESDSYIAEICLAVMALQSCSLHTETPQNNTMKQLTPKETDPFERLQSKLLRHYDAA